MYINLSPTITAFVTIVSKKVTQRLNTYFLANIFQCLKYTILNGERAGQTLHPIYQAHRLGVAPHLFTIELAPLFTT